jgi:hypothetical protein
MADNQQALIIIPARMIRWIADIIVILKLAGIDAQYTQNEVTHGR